MIKSTRPKSFSLVKTLQQVCKAKLDEFSLNELMISASALIRFENHKMEIADSLHTIETLLEQI
jgi:hypothetical protein